MSKSSISRGHFFELLGWIGVLSLLLSYVLLTSNIITGTSAAYQAMILIGSIGFIVSSWHKRNYQPVALNMIFAAISIIALLNIAFH